MIDRKALKASAREAMREAKPHPVWVTLAASAILAVLMGLSMYLSGTFETYRELWQGLMNGDLTASVPTDSVSGFGSFLVLALEIMAAVISVGYVLYCLRVSRRIRASVGDIFDAFGIFLRALVIRVMRGLVLFVWELAIALGLSVLMSLVLVIAIPDAPVEAIYALADSPWILAVSAALYIPMFIVSYFYRLADYFMLDNPGMSCVQCLTMSRMAMRGHKWELFRLDLSFIGWYLLSVIPFAALWVQPYVKITEAAYYNALAPGFLQDLERRLQARMQAAQDLSTKNTHGYHIPGRRDDEDE